MYICIAYVMTATQAFLRYLKNKGIYGPMLNFYHVIRFRKNITCEELYYILVHFLRYSGNAHRWFYTRRGICSFERFIECEFATVNNSKLPKEGDTITVKTLDGKYSFDYIVIDYPAPKFRHVNAVSVKEYNKFKNRGSQNVFLGYPPYTSIQLSRISKLNGKDVNYEDCWELKDQRVYDIFSDLK